MSNSNAAEKEKPPLRLISAAWGDAYVDEFLDFCLPALLAPGNLPALAARFKTELVLLTEFRQFERVRAHPVYRAAGQVCETRLVAVDDLTAAAKNHYGMSITYTLFRGFQDLGEKATDTWLLFMNSDFILADGSYANMIPHLLGDARLIFAPSYCALERPARQLLRAARKPGEQHVSIPHRTMADWILRHRHYTMRAKTVNQRFFSIDCHDQFYWASGETTLLGRQHPVALVAMKPERHLEDVHALWDYGVLADFCPSMNHAALGDSDDFLMMELREVDRAREQLSLGWPSPAQIAKGLEFVVTAYTRAVGRIPLTLHSADLPKSIAAEREEFDSYVESALTRLDGHLRSHLDHIQWTYHLPEYHEARREYLRRFPEGHPTQAEIEAQSGAGNTDRKAQFERTMLAVRAMAKSESRDPTTVDIARLVDAAIRYLENADARREQLRLVEDRHARALAAAYQDVALAREHDPGAEAVLDECIAAMRMIVTDSLQRLQLFEDEIPKLHRQCIDARTDLHSLIGGIERMNLAKALRDTMRKTNPDAPGKSPDLLLTEKKKRRTRVISRVLFGAAPSFHPWHVLFGCTRVGLSTAKRQLANARRVLILAKQDLGLFERLKLPGGQASVVAVELTQTPNALRHCLEGEAPFDCCLVEGHITDMWQFRHIFEEARPLIRPGGHLVAMFLNMDLSGLKERDPEFIHHAFPLCGSARTAYAGSRPAVAALSVRRDVENWLRARRRVPGAIAIAAAMFAAAPLALLGSIVESWRTISNSSARPRKPTSITMEIDIG